MRDRNSRRSRVCEQLRSELPNALLPNATSQRSTTAATTANATSATGCRWEDRALRELVMISLRFCTTHLFQPRLEHLPITVVVRFDFEAMAFRFVIGFVLDFSQSDSAISSLKFWIVQWKENTSLHSKLINFPPVRSKSVFNTEKIYVEIMKECPHVYLFSFWAL